MRAWIDEINAVLNVSLLIVLAVLAFIVLMEMLRARLPTWRESHRRVRRKRDKEES